MHASSTTCPARALDSLHDHDLRAIKARLAEVGGGWLVEQHDDYEGDLAVLLSPLPPSFRLAGCDASAHPSFLLHRTAAGIHLVDTTLDGYQLLGTYQALSAVLARLHHLAGATRGGQEHCAV